MPTRPIHLTCLLALLPAFGCQPESSAALELLPEGSTHWGWPTTVTIVPSEYDTEADAVAALQEALDGPPASPAYDVVFLDGDLALGSETLTIRRSVVLAGFAEGGVGPVLSKEGYDGNPVLVVDAPGAWVEVAHLDIADRAYHYPGATVHVADASHVGFTRLNLESKPPGNSGILVEHEFAGDLAITDSSILAALSAVQVNDLYLGDGDLMLDHVAQFDTLTVVGSEISGAFGLAVFNVPFYQAWGTASEWPWPEDASFDNDQRIYLFDNALVNKEYADGALKKVNIALFAWWYDGLLLSVGNTYETGQYTTHGHSTAVLVTNTPGSHGYFLGDTIKVSTKPPVVDPDGFHSHMRAGVVLGSPSHDITFAHPTFTGPAETMVLFSGATHATHSGPEVNVTGCRVHDPDRTGLILNDDEYNMMDSPDFYDPSDESGNLTWGSEYLFLGDTSGNIVDDDGSPTAAVYDSNDPDNTDHCYEGANLLAGALGDAYDDCD